LQGTVSNKAAIGAKIKVTFKENNIERSVYRDLNCGGSFGANPLRQHIGIGAATAIEKIEIKWPVTGKVQVFVNPPINTNIKITEGDSKLQTYKLARFDFITPRHGSMNGSTMIH
jgi:hypothetical protein